jgi:hypothetical protein
LILGVGVSDFRCANCNEGRVATIKKAADSSGFEDNFSKGRADEKCRGKRE